MTHCIRKCIVYPRASAEIKRNEYLLT